MAWFLRLLLGLCAITLAQGAVAQAARPNHIRAELIAQSLDPRPGGAVNLAIVFTPDPGWHGYWQNPGDAGQGATFTWQMPEGVSAGAPLYPVPQRLLISGLMNHVYDREHAVIVPLRLARGIAAGAALPIRLSARWLACTDRICVPERGEFSIELRAGSGSIGAAAQSRFDGFWSKLPRALDRQARYQISGETIRIGIPYPAEAALADPWFFAATENALSYAAPQRFIRQGDLLIVEGKATAMPRSIEGVLALGNGQGLAVRATPGTVAGAPGLGLAVSAGASGALIALAGAILGGLLLNVMPCVFPIISLKALSLAKAGGDDRRARNDALAYTAGVVLSCLALGGLLLILRAAGQQVGWAFQLQSPAVLFVLLLLAVAVTLNLLGWFELPGMGAGQALAGADGAIGAFLTGALAEFVETPCSGPFMAAALGAALVLPTISALAIFAGLGLGMALPFLAIGFLPAVRRRLPRPRPWMATFRKFLAIPMALTAAALLWLLWRQGGIAVLAIATAGIVVLALVVMIARGRGRRMATAMIAAGVTVFTMQAWSAEKLSASHVARNQLGGTRFTEQALATARVKGPVFLYFTADWCLTCKVNEQTAIDRTEVLKAFEAKGVTVIVGDWTRPDAAIARFLESRGRSGIPLYLYYPAGKDAIELPQLLTPATLIDQLSA